MRDKDNYYKTNGFLKFLRFLNLLEPDVNVLSISKTFMWAMLILLIVVLVYMPANLEVIVSALAVTAGSMMNYSYRRWIQYRREKTGKNFLDFEDEDVDFVDPNLRQIQHSQPDINRNIDSPDGDR